MNFDIILSIIYLALLILSGLKSSRLTNFQGVAHNVLSIFNSLTLSIYTMLPIIFSIF